MQKEICGAKTKAGSPCQNPPVSGRKRCRMHGGKQPRGPDNPNYIHGLYSKYAGESLKAVLAELEEVSTEELVQPDNEIKLMQALIMKAKALDNGLKDLKDLDTISKIIDRLITAKQRSQAIMLEQNRLIPAADIQIFLRFMEELLTDRVGPETTHEIIDQLSTFKISDYEN